MVKVSENAANKIIEYGLADNLESAGKLVEKMLAESAPITHYMGSRRYEDWILRLDGAVVIWVHPISCQKCDDRKRVPVYEPCEACNGKKCKLCRFRGEIKRLIPCFSCIR